MSSNLIDWLVHALAIVGLALTLWLFLSGPALVVKNVLGRLSVLSFPGRIATYARAEGPFGRVISEFLERATNALNANNDVENVRIALDARHTRLYRALKDTQLGIHRAVENVRGLSGVAAEGDVVAAVTALEERTKLVDRIAIDFDQDVEQTYAAGAAAKVTLAFVGLFTIAFATANGTLLNQFFSSMTSVRIFGIPFSAVMSIVFVIGEMGTGFLIAFFGKRTGGKAPFWLFIFTACILATIETVVFAVVSNNFDLDLPLLDQHPDLKLWMGPLGLALVATTTGTGYALHQTVHEIAERRGAERLRRELREADKFVKSLPDHWGRIGQAARQAKAALQDHVEALGERDERIMGAIGQLTVRREELVLAISATRPESWPGLASGGSGDARRNAAQNIGIAVATLVGATAYARVLTVFTIAALAGRVPTLVAAGLGVATAVGFYVAGFLSFHRLELTSGDNGRAQMIRAGVVESAVAAGLALACAAGVIWACAATLGLFGALLGLLLVGGGGLMALLGYGVERAARGSMLIATIVFSFCMAVAGCLLSLIRYVVLWLLAALAWTISAVVSLLAGPLELIIEFFRSRQPSVTVTGDAGKALP